MTDTIGRRLKKAREYRNLTLAKVAEATRIRLEYLRALEADDFSAMPSPVQARGFLRNYSQYLDLDLDQMIDELRAANPEPVADTEVVFEGGQAASTPVQEIPEPESENEETDTETPSEPFWQTWLRRVRSETGEVDSESASLTEAQLVPVPEPDSTPDEEASQGVESEAARDDTEDESHLPLTTSFLEWAKSYLPQKQTDDESIPEIEEEPEPEPEPQLELEPEADISVEPTTSSQEIINEIGLQLRQRREMLSLTLDEIERHTRMRAQFMQALEKGNFDELPSPVQTRGMLSNYASFLDLDVDALLLRFADALQARRLERYPAKPARSRGQMKVPESMPRLRSFIAGDLVFGIGMVLLLVAFSVWGISRVIALQSGQQAEVQAEATGPSISEVLIGTPDDSVVSEVTLIAAEDTPIPALPDGTVEIPTPAPNVNVQLNIVALERSYLKVTVDGEVAFDGRTIPGNAYPFDAEQSIEILAGNGAALRVVYNQRDLGLLGGFGQITRFIYTADEVVEPTPEIPPTTTNTPFLSPTPSITPTPTIAASPTVTPTVLPEDLE